MRKRALAAGAGRVYAYRRLFEDGPRQIGVWLAATVSREAMFALGIVLTVFSLAALSLYTMRVKISPPN